MKSAVIRQEEVTEYQWQARVELEFHSPWNSFGKKFPFETSKKLHTKFRYKRISTESVRNSDGCRHVTRIAM